MNAGSPLRPLFVLSVLAVVSGCTSAAAPSAASRESSVPVAATASGPAPSDTSSAGPSSSATCSIPTIDVALGSDRMTAVDVTRGAVEDVIAFRFGTPSSDPGRAASMPSARIEPRDPPYLSDPAGIPLSVQGRRVAMVRMQGMWLHDGTGTPTYQGLARYDEPGPGLRSVVRAGAFEGYETWLIGFDDGCLGAALAPDGTLEVRISH